jgi:spermidine synthase
MLLSCGLLPAWDQSKVSFGPFEMARRLDKDRATSPEELEKVRAEGQVVYHNEGITTTVTVKEYPGGNIALCVNGKPDASTRDMMTQALSGHVPLLLHSDPKDVVVVGLASGVTVGCVGLYPSVERIDCIEISPAVVEACRYFDDWNYRILDDPRLNLIITDGRSHLNLTDRRYDVIVSEPSSPWIAGLGDLFTREYYEICREKLNPGGVACCWVNSYNIDERGVSSILYTYSSVFPHVLIWEFEPNDYALIGSVEPFSVGYGELARRVAQPKVAADLRRLAIVDTPHLLAQLLFGKAGLERFTKGAVLHTDDNALLEFLAPRSLHQRGLYASMSEYVYQFRDIDLSFLSHSAADAAELEVVRTRVEEIFEAKKLVKAGDQKASAGRREEAMACFVNAVRLDPNSADAQGSLGKALAQAGQADEAIKHLKLATELDPVNVDRYADLTMALSGLDRPRPQEEIEAIEGLIGLDNKNFEAFYNLALTLEQVGRDGEAIERYRQAISLRPDRFEPRANLGALYHRLGELDKAVEQYRQAVRLQPQAVGILMNLGQALAQLERYEQAAEQFAAALRYDPQLVAARLNLARIRVVQQRWSQAIEEYRACLALDRGNLDIRCELGDALLRSGDPEGAIAEYRAVLEADPSHARARQSLDAAGKRLGGGRR